MSQCAFSAKPLVVKSSNNFLDSQCLCFCATIFGHLEHWLLVQKWQFLGFPGTNFLGFLGTLLTKGGGFAGANDGHIIAVSTEWSSIIASVVADDADEC